MSRNGWIAMVVCAAIPLLLIVLWVNAASARLDDWANSETSADQEVLVASASDAGYCSAELKKILRRVLQSCGLLGKGGVRGCQPLEARDVATVSGSDFNALFKPMKERGAIVQFDVEKSDLDGDDRSLIESVFAQQRGASYFFVVARASPDGDAAFNRQLSKARAESVLNHLQEEFKDPDLEKEVGLLWLGEEYAQLDEEFCDWRRSGGEEQCHSRDLNRGAFISWIDCQL